MIKEVKHCSAESAGPLPVPMRRGRGLWTRAAGLLSILTVAGGWTISAQSCCQDRACEQMRFLYGQIAAGYEKCCTSPADKQEACFTDLFKKIDETQSLVLIAKIACDNNEDALVRDTIKEIRDKWLPKIIKPISGIVQNEMIALGRNDYLTIDVSMTRGPNSKPVTVSIVDGTAVNPEAAGGASEGGRSAVPGAAGAESFAVLPANATQSFTSCNYTVPPGSTLNLRFGKPYNGLAFSGSLSIAKLSEFPRMGSADVGLPTAVSLKASALGHKLALDLDKTSPYNTLRLDSTGKGTLGVALTLSSDSSALIGLVQVGSTIYFQLPVEVSADWTTLRLRVDSTTPGDAITPTVAVVLAGSDNQTLPPALTNDRGCTDSNENRIKDGAERFIYAIRSQLGCGSTSNH